MNSSPPNRLDVKGAGFTIGCSNHDFETFVGLLAGHGVTCLADVRSTPWSRFRPAFNIHGRRRRLPERGIEYAFLGQELGGRPEDPGCYEDGLVQYDRLARTETFRPGLVLAEALAGRRRVALMCAEKEPLCRHRTLALAPALEERGTTVRHILADGSLESHEDAMTRLIEMRGLAGSLLVPRAECVRQAIRLQTERAGYRT